MRIVGCTRLKGSEFQKFLSEVRSVYEVITYYSVVRWLSRSAVLSIPSIPVYHLPTDVRVYVLWGKNI